MELKERFGDGKRPTGADFAALIDALWANSEAQLSGVMRVQRVRWARSERPEEFDPAAGEVWYDTINHLLKGSVSYPPREGWVYIVEDNTEEMTAGQYVAQGGKLTML